MVQSVANKLRTKSLIIFCANQTFPLVVRTVSSKCRPSAVNCVRQHILKILLEFQLRKPRTAPHAQRYPTKTTHLPHETQNYELPYMTFKKREHLSCTD